jgi:hypothetical protein
MFEEELQIEGGQRLLGNKFQVEYVWLRNTKHMVGSEEKATIGTPAS